MASSLLVAETLPKYSTSRAGDTFRWSEAPTEAQIAAAAAKLLDEAARPIATNPQLRAVLKTLRSSADQVIDTNWPLRILASALMIVAAINQKKCFSQAIFY